MDWFGYALLASIFFAAFSLLLREFLRDRGDAQIFALLGDFASAVVLFALTPFDQVFINLSPRAIVLILVASGLFATTSFLLVWARQMEEVSRVEIARQTTLIWSFLGGVLLLSETFSLQKLLAVVLILVGALVVLWERGSFRLTRGLTFVLGAAVLVGCSTLITRVIVEDTLSPTLYSGTVFLLASLWLTLVLPDSFRRMKDELRLQQFRLPIAALTGGVSIFFVMKAYHLGEASLVQPVYNTSLIFSVLAGIVVLKERGQLRQKLIGVVITFVGIVILRLL